MADFLLMPVCHLLFPTAIIPVLLFFSIGSPLCLLMSRRMPAEGLASVGHGDNGNAVDCGRNGGTGSGVPSPQGKQSLQSFWRLLGAFAIYSFVLTLRRPVTSESDELARFILSYLALAVTLLLFWVLVIRKSRLPFERILQLFFLAFAVGFFFSPFSTGMVYEILSALLSVTTGLIFMLVWAAVIDVARSPSIHPFTVIGAWGACYGCPRLLLFLADAVLAQLGYSINTGIVASLLSLFGLFVAFFLISRQTAGAHLFLHELAQLHQDEDVDVPLSEANWESLARGHRLTEREGEIFMMICRGYSNRHISKQLHISDNTVKAHRKKIYAKIGVHSKLELEEKIWPG
jgi:DNA-binding CsgD family transcriptional regulator